MLRKLSVPFRLGVCILLCSLSCTRAPSAADASHLLEGRWELSLGHDCRDYGIRSDTLILHHDGKLEQHFVSAYNQRYDATDQHWSYSPENHINFETRKNFFTRQPTDSVIGVAVHENLLVEFGNPAVIVLHPDSDCFYRRVGNE